ncbi:N-acetyl-gamma-glutamyl-phosphate reductase [Paracoccus suum]|uniref:N-acetyl-gamma-glutamyl-phosphate reductase n=1 Tax=Paracoccus suum TaxID=2259340 RepID=A0A344PHT3_9RHOB|nr:N-acetyl-gamma-glutamyl-phosphate reductase [Paracoccus suum]AXC48938.1 N-acetyl-gamma-glutamyl-phosphate reductase [Paracoccus suum]
MARVFIDGEAGTTGLQIRERLAGRSDIDLVRIDSAHRKDPEARRAAFAEADVAILCLPDAAAREAAAFAADLPVRIIDASSAHRVAEGWAYGFAELTADARARIAAAQRVSNPGCYATGAIALLAPLVAAGLIAPEEDLTINAVSGYSGGGKELIAEFKTGEAPDFFVYALGQSHKHLPEIVAHARLTGRPVFAPSVGRFAQGMVVQVPLHLHGRTVAGLTDALRAHYDAASFVRVRGAGDYAGRVVPTALNGSNFIDLSVHGDDARGGVLVAVLDNLGKGASGAAVQNLNLMIGADEGLGL